MCISRPARSGSTAFDCLGPIQYLRLDRRKTTADPVPDLPWIASPNRGKGSRFRPFSSTQAIRGFL
jgi:hypothetical protein